MDHHQLQQRVPGREGEGVVGDTEVARTSLHSDILVFGHFIEYDVIRVQIEATNFPNEQDSQCIRQVDHRVMTLLVDSRVEE